MIKRCFSISMLIVGTVIGAGFASGAEIVSFFGRGGISPLIAPLCGFLVFGCCALFLFLGRKLRPKDVSRLNARLWGRAHTVWDGFLLLNSLIVTAGMMAAFNSIGETVIDFLPVWAAAGGIAAALVVARGIRGVIKVNAVALPLVIVTMLTVCLMSVNHAMTDCDFLSLRPLTCLIYVAMNMVLAASALTSVHELKNKEIIVSSAVAAVTITALMSVIILALNSTGEFYTALPTLNMAKNISPILFGLMLVVITVSVFTTLLTAMNCLTDYAQGIVKNRNLAAFLVLIAGLVLSGLGFERVVGLFYPVIGAVGAVYIVSGVVYAGRSRREGKAKLSGDKRRAQPSSAARHSLFDKRDAEVHEGGKHA